MAALADGAQIEIRIAGTSIRTHVVFFEARFTLLERMPDSSDFILPNLLGQTLHTVLDCATVAHKRVIARVGTVTIFSQLPNP